MLGGDRTRGGTGRRGWGASRCGEAHDRAVVELGGDLEACRGGLRARRSGCGSGWRGRARGGRRRRPRRRWWMVPSLPWTISAARTTLPPKAWPIAWWPRQTPMSGVRVSAAAAMSARQMPASSGVQGPGERRMAEGCIAIAACTSISSLRRTCGFGAELAQIVEEVVGEAVVVVDQEQHSPHPSRARPTWPRGSDGVKGEVAAGSLVGRCAHEGKYLT